jgi:signal transduction histidine kinase
MRRRLTVAILLLVAATLIVTSVGGLLLIQRAATNTAEEQLYSQLSSLRTATASQQTTDFRDFSAFQLTGGYESLSVVGLTAEGQFSSALPHSLSSVDLRTRVLLEGKAVAGRTHNLVYAVVPLDLSTKAKNLVKPPVPYEDTAVLVATKSVRSPVTGIGYFALVGLAALVGATAVAYWLASRFSRPLVTAAQVTGRIAGGDLQARMPESRDDLPEFAALADSIDAMADSLERARLQQRQFLLSVSHDLRTPLTSIRGYAEAIAEGATDDVMGAVDVIRSESLRLERLVRDLLDLARLDAQRFSFNITALSVDQVLDAAAVSFANQAAQAGLTLERSPTTPGCGVMADSDRVAQILSNLIENAFRYARSRVALGAHATADHVWLWVVDDGHGIDPENLPRVFEPHFTAERADSRRSGSGLGLAIVAELASAMGGGARAESPAVGDHGTRILVWLPAAVHQVRLQ